MGIVCREVPDHVPAAVCNDTEKMEDGDDEIEEIEYARREASGPAPFLQPVSDDDIDYGEDDADIWQRASNNAMMIPEEHSIPIAVSPAQSPAQFIDMNSFTLPSSLTHSPQHDQRLTLTDLSIYDNLLFPKCALQTLPPPLKFKSKKKDGRELGSCLNRRPPRYLLKHYPLCTLQKNLTFSK